MHIDTYARRSLASPPWTLFSGFTNAPYPSTTLTQQMFVKGRPQVYPLQIKLAAVILPMSCQ
jgi:hypothetical protein